MKIDCPCGSGLPYKKCCRPLHTGTPAPTPSALMRARYSAYALKKVDYIMCTTHPANPQYMSNKDAWYGDLRDYCRRVQFQKLEVLEIQESPEASEGYVTFRAFMLIDDKPYCLHEKSTFVKSKFGNWQYFHGTRLS